MPIPEQIWAEISIDFITELHPTGTEQATTCMVITDHMTKGLILQDMADVSAKAVARRLIKCYYPYHGLPIAITRDRGPQFTSQIWRRICKVLKIQQRLSTGYHSQTDRATERANHEVEKILQVFITFAQDDWEDQLSIVAAAINNCNAASTGISPFFFTHGYHIDPVATEEGPPAIEDAKKLLMLSSTVSEKLRTRLKPQLPLHKTVNKNKLTNPERQLRHIELAIRFG